MVRNGEHDNLEGWLTEAGSGLLASFARGLRADKAAVTAALREPWSNGQTERQMYERASLLPPEETASRLSQNQTYAPNNTRPCPA